MSQLVQEPGFTAEQLRRLEDEPGLEFVDGQFLLDGHVVEDDYFEGNLEEANVSRESSRAVMTIGRFLGNAQGTPPQVEVFAQELAYRCHPQQPNWVRKPDVSVILKERLTDLGNVGVMPIPPDLAVEVISTHDLAQDVSRKIEEYLAAGFPLIWVVNPKMQIVDVYHGDGRIVRLRAGDEITAEPVLPEFRSQVADFFT